MSLEFSNKRAKFRYEKILQSGLDLFLEKGYKNTSLNDIVKKSGGSFATIYKFFKNKEGLFRAIISESVDKINQKLQQEININKNLNLEDFLFIFSEIYLNVMFRKNTILFHKLILSEGFNSYNIAIGRSFVNDTAIFLNKYLVDFFKKDKFMSKFEEHELSQYAFNFTFLIKEPYFFEAIFFDKDIKITKEEQILHIKRSIKVFLNGILS
ncbi:TetR/AcrR family transcriptional regulator [Campylobacter sp. FMV-PI01]|uniref:TetR/AcrR family transcriptional regulator n=1 Tax=Campylobacter portucalensis TaxID=2608384 RepID=A0A6L5WJ36_9BACT|nr:TetR/AcrR family transcriptional regulator [Campylobacter portucalensis]MSN95731.1 TetR/AcrR family transcriptional regulator [Campylobacter portucalensis]